MSYVVIIRGPAGVGKSAVSRKVATALKGKRFSFDTILRRHGLDIIDGEGIPTRNFIKANNIIMPLLERQLRKGPVILDGCFYRDEQVKNIRQRMACQLFIFSLHAPLDECVRRNNMRARKMTVAAVAAVHALASRKNHGVSIDTVGKSVDTVTREITARIRSMPSLRLPR